MIRVVLPAHLRALARIDREVKLDVTGPVTCCSVLDALEARYPALRGTIRGHDRGPRRAFIRFFACEQDLSHQHPHTPLAHQPGLTWPFSLKAKRLLSLWGMDGAFLGHPQAPRLLTGRPRD